MFNVSKVKGVQHSLKGQCVLAPADLKNIQTVLPGSCGDECIILLEFKRCLSNKSVVNTQHLGLSLVDKLVEKLVKINPFYKQVGVDNSWVHIRKESNPELWWEPLTDEKGKSKTVEETDIEEDVEPSNDITESLSKILISPLPGSSTWEK